MTTAVGVYSDYGNLALSWSPESKLDKRFKVISWAVLTVMLTMGFVLSMIDVPVAERSVRPNISERVAQFIIEKEKVKIEKPKPEPKKETKKILKKKPKAEKPVTKKQEQARNVAEKSGVLALKEQLSDLMDTSEVSSMINTSISRKPPVAPDAASFDRELLVADAAQGSGGIDSNQYTNEISSTELSGYKVAKVQQTLASAKKRRTDQPNVRTREDIAIVFDQNKRGLYSSYNRARRTSPGLKGKIVLEITIAPSGKVVAIKVISSELNDAKLEKRLIARIKSFDFGARDVKTITVTYPIEFLPS